MSRVDHPIGNTSVSRRTALGALAAVATGTFLAGSRIGSGQTPSASPVAATPCASPVASPVASPAASPAASPVVTCDGALTIVAVDLAFEPAGMTIDADTPVTLAIRNEGVLQHDFAIDDLGLATPLLDPGETASITIKAEAGSYSFRCTVAGHAEAGMTGTLTVRAA
jgi:nitrite reductase (NO-forming)